MALGRRADERHAPLGDGPGEVRVLREEPVAGVHRLGARALDGIEDGRGVEVALRGGPTTERVGLVGESDVQCVAVEVGVDSYRPHAQLTAGADDPDRDLAPVRDEHLGEHDVWIAPSRGDVPPLRWPATRFARVEWVEETGSTNADLLAARLGRRGRGRRAGGRAPGRRAGAPRGRTWIDTPGAQLMVSVLLRPRLPAPRLGRLTMAWAVAAAEACQEITGAAVRLKWPNDLFDPAGERKVAGVLAESQLAADGAVEAVVIGMGVNCNGGVPDGLARPRRLARRADRAAGRPRALLIALLRRFDDLYDRLEEPIVADAYRRLSATIGRRVSVEQADGAREGRAEDVTDDGHLVVEIDGRPVTLAAAEVVHLRTAVRRAERARRRESPPAVRERSLRAAVMQPAASACLGAGSSRRRSSPTSGRPTAARATTPSASWSRREPGPTPPRCGSSPARPTSGWPRCGRRARSGCAPARSRSTPTRRSCAARPSWCPAGARSSSSTRSTGSRTPTGAGRGVASWPGPSTATSASSARRTPSASCGPPTATRLEVRRHQRLVPLRWSGPCDVAGVPAGSLVVAFSRRAVIALARDVAAASGQRTGVLYGALPPDTRRAQIERFVAGELDVLCVTDVIGHGINLPARTVVMAETTKYDGQRRRQLHLWEVAQIIGRAGRFGLTGADDAVGEARVLRDVVGLDANATLVRQAVEASAGARAVGPAITHAPLRPDLADLDASDGPALVAAVDAWEAGAAQAFGGHPWLRPGSLQPGAARPARARTRRPHRGAGPRHPVAPGHAAGRGPGLDRRDRRIAGQPSPAAATGGAAGPRRVVAGGGRGRGRPGPGLRRARQRLPRRRRPRPRASCSTSRRRPRSASTVCWPARCRTPASGAAGTAAASARRGPTPANAAVVAPTPRCAPVAGGGAVEVPSVGIDRADSLATP